MSDLKDFFLFYGLKQEDKDKIISSFSAECRFKKGETIYSAEKFSNAIGFIVSGSASAFTDNSNRMVMKKFSAGMSFGAAAVFSGEDRYVSTIIAEEDCVIRFITESELRGIFKEYPQIAVNYITFLSEKIRFLNKKLSIVSCGSTEDTVYRYLINCADEDGVVRLSVNMTVLSRMLGIGRASLYRSLDALENAGMISREKNFIRVKIYEKGN